MKSFSCLYRSDIEKKDKASSPTVCRECEIIGRDNQPTSCVVIIRSGTCASYNINVQCLRSQHDAVRLVNIFKILAQRQRKNSKQRNRKFYSANTLLKVLSQSCYNENLSSFETGLCSVILGNLPINVFPQRGWGIPWGLVQQKILPPGI